MMIASEFFNNNIVLDESSINVLVIENKTLLRKIILGFDNDTIDETLVFSDNYNPIDFKKIGVFISDPLNISFDSRKLINKIFSYLEALSESEAIEKLSFAKESLYSLADELVQLDDYELCYEENLTALSIIKLLDFKINKEKMTSSEQLISYMKMISKYFGINLFVVQNLHMYYDDNEINKLYETVIINHLNLLVIESFQPNNILKYEKQIIVDKDLCIIDNNFVI